jgi:hypothetical protein
MSFQKEKTCSHLFVALIKAQQTIKEHMQGLRFWFFFEKEQKPPNEMRRCKITVGFVCAKLFIFFQFCSIEVEDSRLPIIGGRYRSPG